MASTNGASRTARMSLPANMNGPPKELSPGKVKRRSLAPRKSILKFNNGNDDTTQDLGVFSADNTSNISGGSRKSLARRVSFAAHAQVRLYTKDANSQNSPSGSAPSDGPSQPRRSSLRSRRSSAGRRQSVDPADKENWEEEGSSMDIEDDDGVVRNAEFYVAPGILPEEQPEEQISEAEIDDDEDDMDMTTMLKNDMILAAKRRSSAVARRSSVARQHAEQPSSPVQASPAPSARTDASEPMEFTVDLGQAIFTSTRASLANEAWADLQALQQMSLQDGQGSPTSSGPTAGTDAPRLSVQMPSLAEEGDSMDMSMDSINQGRVSSAGYREDQTMDLTTIVPPQAELSLHEEREQELAGLIFSQSDNPFLLPPVTESSEPEPVNERSGELFSSLAPFTFHPQPISSPAAPSQSPPSGPGLSLPSFQLSVADAGTQNTASQSIIGSGTELPPLPDFLAAPPIFSRSTSAIQGSSTFAPSNPILATSTSSVITRSKIPSPVKKVVKPNAAPSQGETQPEPVAQTFPTPSKSTPKANASSTPSKRNRLSATPSTPSRGASAPPESTPSRKRSRSPVKASTPNKRLAVGEDAASQRAIPVEPNGGSQETDDSQDPNPPSREISAPPELQTTAASAPSRRASSSFAMRRARKNSIVPPTVGSNPPLAAIVEQRESLGASLMRASQPAIPPVDFALFTSMAEAGHAEGGFAALEQPAEPVYDDYEQPLSGQVVDEPQASTSNRSLADRPRISVQEFLDMADIRFHDAMPLQRRQTLGPDTMTMEDGTLGPIPHEGHEFSLADYYRAEAVDLAQLEIYAWATSEIKNQMASFKEQLEILEEEIEENPPNVVLDYLEADDEIRPQIEMALKHAKSYAKRVIRGDWYRWRKQWTKDLEPHVEEEITNLESHLTFVREQREQLRDPIEELRQMHATLKEELEKERAVIAEIEACDAGQLKSLKTGIAEQSTVLEVYKADVAQAQAELDRHGNSHTELKTELQAAQDVIATSKRRGDMLGTTMDDVLKKREWFHLIQSLHGWRIHTVSPSVLQVEYQPLCLTIRLPLRDLCPNVEAIELSKASSSMEGEDESRWSGIFTSLLQNAASTVKAAGGRGHRTILRQMNALFTSYSLILTELKRLWIKHPVQVTATESGALKVGTTIILKGRPTRAKVLVTFSFSLELLQAWPERVSSLDVSAEVPYGNVSPEAAISLIQDRLRQSTADQHYCTLYDACGEITTAYAEGRLLV